MTPKQETLTARNGAMRALREKGLTLQAIGDKYGLTRERVRQVLDKEYNQSRRGFSTAPTKLLDKK